MATMRWEAIEVHGSRPGLKNHTTTLVDGKLFVFGGYDGRRNHNSVHMLDTGTLKWTTASVGGKVPDGRNGHTATLAAGKIYVIGGWLGDLAGATNDLHVLDTFTMRWSEPEVSGISPGPCNMHTAEFIESRNALLVFRGGDGKEYLNDLHSLDLSCMHWDKPAATGCAPLPRANHSSAVVGERMYVFGGWDGQQRLNDVHVLCTKTMAWSKPETTGNPPSPRAGMTFTRVRGRIFLFGGSGPRAKCLNDLHVYDPPTECWLKVNAIRNGRFRETIVEEQEGARGSGGNPNADPRVADLEVRGKRPGRRSGHTCTLIGCKVFLFGGSYGSNYFFDFHVLASSMHVFGLKWWCSNARTGAIAILRLRTLYRALLFLSSTKPHAHLHLTSPIAELAC